MIDVDALLEKRFPNFNKHNNPLLQATSVFLKKLLHQKEINQFISTHRHLDGIEFLDAVLDHFDFKYRVSNRDRQNIPAQGRVIIVANHPLGSLDGLALVKFISEIRPDVKIVATTFLNQIKPLTNLFISVDNMSKQVSHIRSMRSITSALESEQAVIIFPTGEVSRIKPYGVRDGKWKSGFVLLAKKTQSAVLPVYIEGKNSAIFYSLSTLFKPLGTMMLVNEMFNKHDKEISLKVGKPVPYSSMESLNLSPKQIAARMRKQVYSLAKKRKKELFVTIQNIVHPANRKLIRSELKQSELIGITQDGKQIYLFDYRSNSSVMREIGRLRELSFRQVHEGTGNAIDIDEYDRYYRHLILWDDDELEIVGTYRIGEGLKIITQKGVQGLYCNSLFELSGGLIPYLEKSIELGRSFIQPKYWGKRNLDYLWYGIGAYLQKHPEIEYMLGPVSMSASYPEPARQLMVNFYLDLFGSDINLVRPRHPYPTDKLDTFNAFRQVTEESEYKKAYSLLNKKLDTYGVRVPTLFKQYVEICKPGGCEFLGFNIDAKFSDCIDAMILVHIDAMHEKKRQRYIDIHNKSVENAA